VCSLSLADVHVSNVLNYIFNVRIFNVRTYTFFLTVFAVGAYESDTVAVLRANPVVSMETLMYVRPDRITASEPQVYLTVCFMYTGNAVTLPNTLRKFTN